MIVTQENQRLYFTRAQYNFSRINTALAEIVTANGGRVKPYKSAIISDRTTSGAIQEKRERIAKLEERRERLTPDGLLYLDKLRDELTALENTNNDPVTVTHTSYISFIFGNDYYYFNCDSMYGGFSSDRYTKTPINAGSYSRDASSDEIARVWCPDPWQRLSDDDIHAAALVLFETLTAAPHTEIIRTGRRQRVRNIYNDGYHYETIYERERIAKIDF